MAGEEWARRIIERELGRSVALNDDNSQAGMYDLRIGVSDTPEIAIECVGAVDSIFTEAWNIGPAKGPLYCPLAGNWTVIISRGARVKVIKQEIGSLLQELEMRGLYDVRVDHWLKRSGRWLFDALEALGIEGAWCSQLEGTGKVHLTLPGTGGAVDETGSAVPGWISDFLHAPARSDVLGKLGRSGAMSCHVFVLVDFLGAPWPIESYLAGDLDKLPLQQPDLPISVDEVWIVHVPGFRQRGLRWNGEAWRSFKARSEDIERQPKVNELRRDTER
jgi:hypothetical protein